MKFYNTIADVKFIYDTPQELLTKVEKRLKEVEKELIPLKRQNSSFKKVIKQLNKALKPVVEKAELTENVLPK